LKFIASSQKPDGHWEWSVDDRKDWFKGMEASRWWPGVTSLNGLALYASGSTTREGPYREELRKARDWIVRYLTERFRPETSLRSGEHFIERQAMPVMLMFLCQLYEQEKGDDLKILLEQVREHLLSFRAGGGWSYLGEGGGGMTHLTNLVIVSLVGLQSLGHPVPDTWFGDARQFYIRMQNEDGGYPYRAMPESERARGFEGSRRGLYEAVYKSQAGGTAGALWAMYLLGMKETETFQKAKVFLEGHYAEVAHSNHGPGFHLFFATQATRAVDQDLWERFWHTFREGILAGQNEEGSMVMEAPAGASKPIDGKSWGRSYATGFYALVLQRERHLILDKLVPMGGTRR
jgi:hypothetical protein